MSVHSGEKAKRTGEYRCEKCRNYILVVSGRQIPRCPNCGNDSFDLHASGPE